jgi:carbamoyltransferase
MNILGISAGFHDAGAAVVDGNTGDILFAAHSERYSKQKNDADLCQGIAETALSYGPIGTIAYYETPWLKQLRQLYSGQGVEWDKLSTKKIITDQLGFNISVPVRTYQHHLSHAAAGFQTSPFDRATVVVIDAIGEWDTITIWAAEYINGQAQYNKLWGQKYPHSLGLFYSAMTQRAGLKPLDEEYILMGMAAYGTADPDMLADFVQNLDTLEFRRNLHTGADDYRPDMSDFDIAASAQQTLETCLASVMTRARAFGWSTNLVYMGGVALNCSANARLGQYFDDIWIMPNPGDCGSSLGAAALAYGGRINWQHPYLGTEIPGPYPVAGLMNELLTRQIVGVASGRAEFGPRALGNRSLLADPRGSEIKDRVNEIKRRQKFRPFAPVILQEHANDYFEMPVGFATSPYMQVIAKCRHPEQFPAIIHVDGTSRVQTVAENCGSGIRQLLESWYAQTGCPMLLNTSLNIRGEPMVDDRADADRFEQLYDVKVMS